MEGKAPGKIIIRGLEIVLFKDCKVIHYFNKKMKSLYSHRKKSISSQGSDTSNTSSDMNNSSDLLKLNRSLVEKDRYELTDKNLDFIIIEILKEDDIQNF